ncbi:MAG TPA: PilX N-terminal domain-containing pilus assembly protein [Terriglobia bacterium]|nr:PilX N-terminal domain-containing pilus assembly protein [Terriglobia bacterium]
MSTCRITTMHCPAFCDPHCRSEQGIALVVSLLALALMSLIGLTLVFVSTTEVLIGRNTRAQLSNSYWAESACEEARNRIVGFLSDPTGPLSDSSKAVYIVSTPSINPTGGTAVSNPFFDPEFHTASDFTLVPSNLNRPGFAWVRITQKTERRAKYNLDSSSNYLSASNTNLDGPVFYGFSTVLSQPKLTQYVNSGAHLVECTGTPVYQLTVLVRDKDGIRFSSNSDISRIPVPPLRAALYAKGPLSISSAGVQINGQDEAGLSSPLDALESQDTISGDLTHVNGAPTSVHPGSPFTYEMGPLCNLLRPPVTRSIEKVAPTISRFADGTFVGDGLSLGRVPVNGDHSEAAFCDGSLTLSNSEGQGVLFVNGDFTVSGTFSYYGLIIVRGRVNLNGDSGGGVEIHGAILSYSDAGPQVSNLSGNVRIFYHSAIIQQQFNALGFARLNYRNAF